MTGVGPPPWAITTFPSSLISNTLPSVDVFFIPIRSALKEAIILPLLLKFQQVCLQLPCRLSHKLLPEQSSQAPIGPKPHSFRNSRTFFSDRWSPTICVSYPYRFLLISCLFSQVSISSALLHRLYARMQLARTNRPSH